MEGVKIHGRKNVIKSKAKNANNKDIILSMTLIYNVRKINLLVTFSENRISVPLSRNRLTPLVLSSFLTCSCSRPFSCTSIHPVFLPFFIFPNILLVYIYISIYLYIQTNLC